TSKMMLAGFAIGSPEVMHIKVQATKSGRPGHRRLVRTNQNIKQFWKFPRMTAVKDYDDEKQKTSSPKN
ncbi:MAG: hypothetical protein FD147_2433, partial [Chloroflexi bacterium]